MRVPRSSGMIFGMFLALIMTCLMPVVFLAALAQSTEQHPRPLRQTLAELGRPLADQIEQLAARFR
jgi:hypothetical protein